MLARTQRDPAIFRCSARGVLGLGVKSSDSRAVAAEGLSATRCTSSGQGASRVLVCTMGRTG